MDTLVELNRKWMAYTTYKSPNNCKASNNNGLSSLANEVWSSYQHGYGTKPFETGSGIMFIDAMYTPETINIKSIITCFVDPKDLIKFRDDLIAYCISEVFEGLNGFFYINRGTHFVVNIYIDKIPKILFDAQHSIKDMFSDFILDITKLMNNKEYLVNFIAELKSYNDPKLDITIQQLEFYQQDRCVDITNMIDYFKPMFEDLPKTIFITYN